MWYKNTNFNFFSLYRSIITYLELLVKYYLTYIFLNYFLFRF